MSEESTTSNSPVVPVELLHKIVVFKILKYLDDVIAGPLSIPPMGVVTYGQSPDIPALREALNEFQRTDTALDAPNPVTALLAASYQLRDITMKALSTILGIDITPGRIARYVVMK